MKNAIKANKKKIDAFKGKVEEAGSQIKAMYGKEVRVLERRNRDVKKKLEEYKKDGQSKWDEFKTGIMHDMNGVGKTMKDLFKH